MALLSLSLFGQWNFPRCYFTEPVDQIEHHVFGDSSQDVFCGVGFLRARLSSSLKTQISFIFGKTRVAPMKALSIPKLEPQAALLATRLKNDILTALTVCNNHVYMCTDSTTVLQRLNSTEIYLYSSRTVSAKSSNRPLSMAMFWAVKIQLIPVRGGFLRKPSRIAAGLLVRAFSGLLIGRLYPTNV